MKTAVFKSNSKDDLLLLVKVARKLGVNAKLLSEDEIEDICLSKAIKEGKTGEYVPTENLIKSLRK
ncbi:MAG: hypothetical protein R6V04_14865 [bacterium]